MGQRNDDRCRKVLSFVASFVENNGYPPTCEEIRNAVGLSSKSHAAYYLGILEREGVIERTPRSPRGLRLVGDPQPACQGVEGYLDAGPGQFFATCERG